jgi:hypothetical protein
VPKFQKKRARNLALEHPGHENFAAGLAFAISSIGVYVMKAATRGLARCRCPPTPDAQF